MHFCGRNDTKKLIIKVIWFFRLLFQYVVYFCGGNDTKKLIIKVILFFHLLFQYVVHFCGGNEYCKVDNDDSCLIVQYIIKILWF
jgi:hypothetical protein